jgi:hypothetical protein
MNRKQRILTLASASFFVLSLFFVPWPAQGGHYRVYYEFSPYWRPIIFDEGGALRPVLLYWEWSILAVVYTVLYACLKTTRPMKTTDKTI